MTRTPALDRGDDGQGVMTARQVRPAPHQLVRLGELARLHTSGVAASSPPADGLSAATDKDMLLRLALWLADVAAEASVGKSAP